MSFAHPFYTPAILALAGGCHAVVAQRVCIREIRCRSPISCHFGDRSGRQFSEDRGAPLAAIARPAVRAQLIGGGQSHPEQSTAPGRLSRRVSAIKIPDTADTQEKGLRVAADFLSCHHWPAPTQ